MLLFSQVGPGVWHASLGWRLVAVSLFASRSYATEIMKSVICGIYVQ